MVAHLKQRKTSIWTSFLCFVRWLASVHALVVVLQNLQSVIELIKLNLHQSYVIVSQDSQTVWQPTIRHDVLPFSFRTLFALVWNVPEQFLKCEHFLVPLRFRFLVVPNIVRYGVEVVLVLRDMRLFLIGSHQVSFEVLAYLMQIKDAKFSRFSNVLECDLEPFDVGIFDELPLRR